MTAASAGTPAPANRWLLAGDEGEAAVVNDEDVAAVRDGDGLGDTVNGSYFDPVLSPRGGCPDFSFGADPDHSGVVGGCAESGEARCIWPSAECCAPVGTDEQACGVDAITRPAASTASDMA